MTRLGLNRFGTSATGDVVLKELGFPMDHVIERALMLVRAEQAT